MARTEFVLSIGDDNVVLTHFSNGKVKNAWLADPDPDMAHEELGEALRTDRKAEISIVIDTLDQTYQQDDLPKVGLLDRRKILNRHMAQEFSGQNLRGAKLVRENKNKTLTYQFVAIPIAGRIPGWLDFVNSLPNELAGIHAIATEAVGMIGELTPQDLEPVEEGNHWRHIIGVNTTGGFRQIIEKNGSLGFTRLTQAPPEDTPADEFADNINRDFKATVTYIKRLGYVAADTLDLVILTSEEIKPALSGLDWGEARSVTVLTPYEAAQQLELGSIGREDQAFCDILYATWVANQRTPAMKLTRAAIGDTKDDLKELGFFIAPYAASISMLALFFYLGWSLYRYDQVTGQQQLLRAQLAQSQSQLREREAAYEKLPYDANEMRSVFSVVESLEAGAFELTTDLNTIQTALDGEAVVMSLDLEPRTTGASANAEAKYTIVLRMRLDELIRTADEALEVSRRLEERLAAGFADGYQVEMILEPVGAQSNEEFSGGLFGESASGGPVETDEPFYAEYRIVRG